MLCYNELKKAVDSNFLNTKIIKGSILKNPKSLLSLILIQKSAKSGWDMSEVEICLQVKDEHKPFNPEEDSLLLEDLKIIGGCWDSSKKAMKFSE
jgi:hypothetical protein